MDQGDELYDAFLFDEDTRVEQYDQSQFYDRDLFYNCSSLSDEYILMEQETRALDELIKLLSREGREYLAYKLQNTPLRPVRRVSYSQVKNTETQKHLRHVLLLMANLVSKGDANELIIDTAEDLQVASSMCIEDPYNKVKIRKRRRKAAGANGREDLASKLLGNLSVAYKFNCNKRSEKKRILSIAAPEITFREGIRLFGCGPNQFSEAKKHAQQFGPFADPKALQQTDAQTMDEFIKQRCDGDLEVAWNDFCRCYIEVATRVGYEAFWERWKQYQSDSHDSVSELMDLDSD